MQLYKNDVLALNLLAMNDQCNANVKDIYEMQTDRVQLDVFEYLVCF